MGPTFQLALCLGMLALCFASPVSNIRWCVRSGPELRKCRDLEKTCGSAGTTLSCVQRVSAEDCFKAISAGEADAVTLDSGEVYDASLFPYSLRPVAAENYGNEKAPDTCYYSVALVSQSSDFQFKDLKGKKSCHTAVGRAAGWDAPVGYLVAVNLTQWEGPEIKPVEKAVAEFFSAACAPGADDPTLCKLCKGIGPNKCKASHVEPYFGYDGAYQCLCDGVADVSFVKHILPADAATKFELLCPDNTRKRIKDYKDCHISRIPAHAVVTEDKEEKIKAVTQFLEEAQKKADCKLFGSPYGKDLMFKDSAKGLLTLPERMDAFLYLGRKFTKAKKALHVAKEPSSQDKIRWCTQSKEEMSKCDNWSIFGRAIDCIEASSAEECITKVLKGEADAVTLDGGYLNTAGECGLIPVMQEIYDADVCKQRKLDKRGTYYAVAIAKTKDKDITWNKLRNSKSCHTGLGRTSGYNIPAGLIHRDTGSCDLSKFFKESCIPGADPKSNLCSLCAGNPDKSRDTKCFPNSQEQYYSYAGALRCLIEAGDVAFVKQTTLGDVLDNNPPDWAKGWNKNDFELLCLDGTRKPITEYKSCHLALVPSHAVVTTPERKETVVRIIKEQADAFGRGGHESENFQLFTSEGTKDQLFKDSTQCLREVQESNMRDFLGNEYSDAISQLNTCGKSGLLAACTFHTCKV